MCRSGSRAAFVAWLKAPEGWRSPRRCANSGGPSCARSVVECGGPPPLWLDKVMDRSKIEAMNLRVVHHKTAALTRTDVVVVIAVLAVLALLSAPYFLARYSSRPSRSYGLYCENNLKQVGLAYWIWAGDNGGKYPMQISVMNGGTMEFAATGDVVKTFQIMSNELSTPKVLYCPLDSQKTNAVNFGRGFTAKNISYFIGLDASSNRPQSLLVGDANFAVGGVPVSSGLLLVSTNTPLTWTSTRHVPVRIQFWTPDSKRRAGNIMFNSGSLDSITDSVLWLIDDKRLVQAFAASGLATNRLAIP